MVDKTRAPYIYKAGGLIINNDDLNGTTVVSDFLKGLAKKVVAGQILDLMKISRPARMSDHHTLLQAVSRDFQLCDNKLQHAAATTDPMERLKWILGFYLGGLHTAPMESAGKAPLNPILGETLQLKLSSGTELFCEQISHHPPISAWQLFDGQGKWSFCGHGETVAQLVGPNTVKASRKGINYLKFADGGSYRWENPKTRIGGLIAGDRVMDYIGSFSLIDEVNQIGAEITFSTETSGNVAKVAKAFSSWWSGSSSGEEKKPNDTFLVNLFQYSQDPNAERVVLETGEGSWLGHLEFGGKRYWEMTDVPEEWQPIEPLLESDSTFRIDSIALKAKDWANAQKNKEFLEDIQRKDKAKRLAGVDNAQNISNYEPPVLVNKFRPFVMIQK